MAGMDDVSGRVAVITGGASGIGFAFAREFAAAGMKIMLGDIEESALRTAEATLVADGADVSTFVVDVASASAVEDFAAATFARFGAVHVLCNNAGVVTWHDSWGSLDDWKWVLDVDLWGVIHGMHSFLPPMLESGEPGHIVNTGSVAGLLGFPKIAAYTAAKHAVVGLSQSLHHELEETPIGVSVLCPGLVLTNINTSARNRPGVDPATVSAPTSEGAEALAPEDVAVTVLDAIRTNRFWILPHPHYGEQAALNIQNALAGGPPVKPQVKR